MYECKICKIECNDNNAMKCDPCGGYVHFTCSQLPVYLITFIKTQDKSSYCCPSCAEEQHDYKQRNEGLPFPAD